MHGMAFKIYPTSVPSVDANGYLKVPSAENLMIYSFMANSYWDPLSFIKYSLEYNNSSKQSISNNNESRCSGPDSIVLDFQQLWS